MRQFQAHHRRETPIGWVPASWAIEPLERLAVDTITYGVVQPGEQASGGVPLVRGGDVKAGRISSQLRTVTTEIAAQFERTKLRGGELLVSLVGFPGETAIAPQSLAGANIARQVGMVRLGNVVDPRFVQQYLSSPQGRKVLLGGMIGSAQQVVNLSSLRVVLIPVPPKAEQQKIAAILTAVDDKLDVIARQITATQALKLGLMQTLFTKGVGTQDADGHWLPHTAFKQTVIGAIPVGWSVGMVGDFVSELRSGVSVNGDDRTRQDAEVGVLKVSSVFGGKFHPSEHKTVLPAEVDRVAEPVQAGSIIVSRANTPSLVGESAYVEVDYPDLFLPDKLWQTKPSQSEHCVRWLSFFLQSPGARQEIAKAATGTSGSMKNISKAAFLGISMPIIPIAEQRKIAEVLLGVSKKQDVLQAKHQHYQTLKRGLMQKLLTGEWRVKVDDTNT